jgi:hypothetical protein
MREGVRRQAIAWSRRLLPVSSGGPRGALVAVGAILALASAAHSAGHVWSKLDNQRAQYASLTELQRRHAFVEQLGIPGDPFDFYAAYVGRGDRVFYQVKASGLGHFLDLPQSVAAVGRYYLLPAVYEPDLRRATVVVTWEDDPARLHVPFVDQQRSGVQQLFVSRIAR